MSDDLNYTILKIPMDSDKTYRDATLMAYTSAVMDLPVSYFYNIILKDEADKKAFIETMKNDLENRLARLLK